mmetsp:Transcript_58372/g.177964  ORF Transcript_58372/g.177964 Transcript_58372/m.177964 type:complete len:203 (-) Transcript_58372:127-735(-)
MFDSWKKVTSRVAPGSLCTFASVRFTPCTNLLSLPWCLAVANAMLFSPLMRVDFPVFGSPMTINMTPSVRGNLARQLSSANCLILMRFLFNVAVVSKHGVPACSIKFLAARPTLGVTRSALLSTTNRWALLSAIPNVMSVCADENGARASRTSSKMSTSFNFCWIFVLPLDICPMNQCGCLSKTKWARGTNSGKRPPPGEAK